MAVRLTSSALAWLRGESPVQTVTMGSYYEDIGQSEDRIGLVFYANMVKRYCPAGSLLDFGCGTGHFLRKFPAATYTKIGYDPSAEAMSRARSINPDTLFVTDPSIELANSSLDIICSLHVLEHICDPALTVKLFHDKLKNGGLLIVVVPNDSSIGKRLKHHEWFAYRDPTHCSLLTVDAWIQIMSVHGFRVRKTATDGLWDVPYLKYVPLWLQKLLFFPTAAVQYWTNRLFLPLAFGEDLIIIAEKQTTARE